MRKPVYRVKIKPDDPKRRYKWYWASDPKVKPLGPYETGNTSGNTMAGKELIVQEHDHRLFEGTYRYTDSLFIDKDDCIILETL